LTLDEGRKLSKLNPDAQATVAKGLMAAKEMGDKTAKRKIKKGLRAATSRSGVARPSSKEISYNYNAAGTILKAMTDAKDQDTKPFITLSGFYFGLEWTLGKRKYPQLSKLLEKYKIDLDSKGNRVKHKQYDLEDEAKKKAAAKKDK